MAGKRGGKRPGAGRPRKPSADRAVTLCFTAKPSTAEVLEQYQQQHKLSRSAALERLIHSTKP